MCIRDRNSIMKLIFTVTILFYAFKYFGVTDHVLCDDLKALLGSQENQDRFLGRWTHIIISFGALILVIGQAFIASFNVFSSLRNDGNFSDRPEDELPGKSIEISIFLPVLSIFLTRFIGVTQDHCHAIGLMPGGQWLILFTNSNYDFIFWSFVALTIFAPIVAFLDNLINQRRSGLITIIGYVLSAIFTILFGGYIAFNGFRFAISYTFYSKSLILRGVFAASLIVGVTNLCFYIYRTIQRRRYNQAKPHNATGPQIDTLLSN
eukprot:TRINITY_DN9651_c0_g1_i1.p1 TRINITY_DN9651_c0_g1~~TRINITY_DN9651_c0_g1_i1.p1  ORF type:complete len:283 (+),score=54.94 TRINITY_DN9651_c0_g1_i1:60-851(+)